MNGFDLMTDWLWPAALGVIPLALIAAGACRCLDLRASTRHALWLTVLLCLFVPPIVPSSWPSRLPDAGILPAGSSNPLLAKEPQRTAGRPAWLTPHAREALGAPPRVAPRSTSRPERALRASPGNESRGAGTSGSRPPPTAAATRSDATTTPGLQRILTGPPGPGRVARAVTTRQSTPSAQRPETRTSQPPAIAPAPTEIMGPMRPAIASVAQTPPPEPVDPWARPIVSSGNGTGPAGSLSFWGREIDAWRAWLPRVADVREAVAALPPVPSALWLGGAGILGLIALGQLVALRRLMASSEAAPEDVMRVVEYAAHTIGLKRAPRTIMVSARVSPMVSCWGRSRLILPRALWDELDETGREAVVLHELAHLKRRDHWVCYAEMAASAVFWWHPVVWWVRQKLREEADACCDAWVTTLRPRDRRSYAQALLDTRAYLSGRSRALPGVGLGVSGGGAKRFARRLTMVMKERGKPRLSVFGVALAGMLGLIGAASTPLWACPPEEKEKAAAEAKARLRSHANGDDHKEIVAQAHKEAERARAEAEKVRVTAQRQAEKARAEAEKVRARALKDAEKQREQALKTAEGQRRRALATAEAQREKALKQELEAKAAQPARRARAPQAAAGGQEGIVVRRAPRAAVAPRARAQGGGEGEGASTFEQHMSGRAGAQVDGAHQRMQDLEQRLQRLEEQLRRLEQSLNRRGGGSGGGGRSMAPPAPPAMGVFAAPVMTPVPPVPPTPAPAAAGACAAPAAPGACTAPAAPCEASPGTPTPPPAPPTPAIAPSSGITLLDVPATTTQPLLADATTLLTTVAQPGYNTVVTQPTLTMVRQPEGEVSARRYSIPAGKREALWGLMAREDVPIFVSSTDDGIEVNATPRQHAIFAAFLNMIHPGATPDADVSSIYGTAAQDYEALANFAQGLAPLAAEVHALHGSLNGLHNRAAQLGAQAEAMAERARTLEEQADQLEEQADEVEEDAEELEGEAKAAAVARARELKARAHELRSQANVIEATAEELAGQAEGISEEVEALSEDGDDDCAEECAEGCEGCEGDCSGCCDESKSDDDGEGDDEGDDDDKDDDDDGGTR